MKQALFCQKKMVLNRGNSWHCVWNIPCKSNPYCIHYRPVGLWSAGRICCFLRLCGAGLRCRSNTDTGDTLTKPGFSIPRRSGVRKWKKSLVTMANAADSPLSAKPYSAIKPENICGIMIVMWENFAPVLSMTRTEYLVYVWTSTWEIAWKKLIEADTDKK